MRKVLEQPDAGRQLIHEREDVYELGGVQRPAAALVSLDHAGELQGPECLPHLSATERRKLTSTAGNLRW